jgi:hypothetical protein
MQLDAILEVAIGVVFSWLILSVATMEIQNWINQKLDKRAKFLEETILDMFKNEQSLVDQFYNHPAIKELSKLDKKGRLKKPDNIPSPLFAEVAIEILLNVGKQGEEVPAEAMSFDVMESGLNEAKKMNPELSRLIDRICPTIGMGTSGGPGISYGIEDITKKVAEYRRNAEKWFDNLMDSASSWYKQNALAWAFGIGFALAVVFNIDTVNITKQLWREPTVRQALVAQAQNFELANGTDNVSQIPGYFDSLAMPVGWTSVPAADASACNQFVTITPDGGIAYHAGNECRVLANVPVFNDIFGWVIKLLGFVISAFAARQGAPFWFDLLRKLVNLRSATQPAKKEEAKG